MDLQQKTRRFGACILLCALLLRLASAGILRQAAQWLSRPHIASFLIYLETGRDVRFSLSEEQEPAQREQVVHVRESPPPAGKEKPLPVISSEDAALVAVTNSSLRDPDLEQLLKRPLDWDLTGEEPRVLILHTHTTESYTSQGEPYTETSRYRTLDEKYNMLSIGDAVAQALMEQGIGVIHDRTMHDYPSYNGAYVHARNSVKEILEEYPGICLVLDLHRDASGSNSSQLRTEAKIGSRTAGQLMLVMGTGHSGWEENLSLGLKLHALLERNCTGLMRPISLRSQRFNQDLCGGMLLVEVGAAGNTHAEAILAAKMLGQTLAEMAKGIKTE